MTILNKTSQKPYFFKIFGCFFIFIKFVSILLVNHSGSFSSKVPCIYWSMASATTFAVSSCLYHRLGAQNHISCGENARMGGLTKLIGH